MNYEIAWKIILIVLGISNVIWACAAISNMSDNHDLQIELNKLKQNMECNISIDRVQRVE